MLEDAEHLFVQGNLIYLIVMIETRLGTPTNMECAGDVFAAPVHYLGEFVPVVHGLEVHLLHGGTSDNHAIVATVADLVEGLIERAEMVGRGVF